MSREERDHEPGADPSEERAQNNKKKKGPVKIIPILVTVAMLLTVFGRV